MPEFLIVLLEKYKNLSIGKKVFYPLGIGTLVAVIAVLSLWMQRPQYKVLFGSLNDMDASKVMEMLESKNVPYKITSGGSVIKVPADQVYQLRLAAVGEGVISSGSVGYEIFDKTTMGMTEFVQKINYQRALQGEIERTIRSLQEIENARVHLVLPEKRLFVENKKQATASIVIKTVPGRMLSPNQVDGIIRLVASSVEGLSFDNVTLIDSRGNVLSKTSAGSGFEQSSSTQFAYQRKFEKEMSEKVKSMLEKIVGPESVVVRTSVLLDFKKVEQTEERFDPDLVAVRSEQKSQENQVGGTSGGGIPGVASNLPGGESLNAAIRNEQKSNKKSQTINYEISKTLSTTIFPAGSIVRLSVAVLLDGTYNESIDGDGNTVREFIPRGQEEMAQIKSIVEKTVGFDASRGDQIEVTNIPFENTADSMDVIEASMIDKVTPFFPIARLVILALVLLLVFFFGIRPMVRDLLSQKVSMVRGGGGGAQVSAAGADLLNMGIETDKGSMAMLSKQEILRISKENPKQAAMLIKRWLKDSE